MTVTAVEITRRPATATAAVRRTAANPDPADVVIVSSVEALTATNQRGCGNDNPYN